MLYTIFGYRKRSLLGDKAPGTKKVIFGKVPIRDMRDGSDIDLSGSHEVNQGKVGACACATLAGLVQDAAVQITRDKTLEINWKEAWEIMKKMGLADDKKGSYLSDNLWFFQNIGFKDNKGNIWKPDKIQKISRSKIVEYIRMGYQVYTGANVGRPMCTRDWVFRTGYRKYGHSFRCIGLRNGYILEETTWLNYGLKKESQFFYDKNEVRRLFTPYVMTVKIV